MLFYWFFFFFVSYIGGKQIIFLFADFSFHLNSFSWNIVRWWINGSKSSNFLLQKTVLLLEKRANIWNIFIFIHKLLMIRFTLPKVPTFNELFHWFKNLPKLLIASVINFFEVIFNENNIFGSFDQSPISFFLKQWLRTLFVNSN